MTQIFKKEVSTRTSAVVFGVLIIACLFAFYVSAGWNEPSQSPPAGNVPAPINVGPTAQQKTGTLTVPMVYDSDNTSYWVNPGGIQIFAGPVGIGPTNAPFHKLEIAGIVKFGPTSEPTQYVSDGLMYYDQSLDKFRCYQNGWVDCISSTGGSAPTDASYVVLGLNSTLTAERVLTAGKGISITDAGANGNLTLGLMNCATGQIVKYNSSGQWVCAADETGAGGGITGGGTSNQVAFFTGPTSIFSDSGLYWDNVNKRLRISKSDGTSPTTLKVQNTFGGATADTRIILGTSNDVGVDTVGAVLLADRTDAGGAGSTDLKFQTSSSTTMNTWLTIKADGKIGVGTVTPTQALDVNGYVKGRSGLCIGDDCRTSWPRGDVQAEESLKMVRGSVNLVGTNNQVSGSGFTATKTEAGRFLINFTTPFNGNPTVVASLNAADITGATIYTTVIDSSNVRIETRWRFFLNTNGAGCTAIHQIGCYEHTDYPFSFIAVGPR